MLTVPTSLSVRALVIITGVTLSSFIICGRVQEGQGDSLLVFFLVFIVTGRKAPHLRCCVW